MEIKDKNIVELAYEIVGFSRPQIWRSECEEYMSAENESNQTRCYSCKTYINPDFKFRKGRLGINIDIRCPECEYLLNGWYLSEITVLKWLTIHTDSIDRFMPLIEQLHLYKKVYKPNKSIDAVKLWLKLRKTEINLMREF